MKEFKIVESDCTKEFYGVYDGIKEDYLLGMKIMDIKKKYGLRNNQWRKYRREMMEDGTWDKKPKRKARYVTYGKTDGRWRIVKTINNKSTTYLTFKEEKDALKAVELFKKYGWSKKNSEKIRLEVLNGL